MKVQIIHAKEFWFKSHKPATKIREPRFSLEKPVQNALVVFMSIEKSDNDSLDEISEAFSGDLLKLVESLKPNTIVLYPYAHLSDNLAPPSLAISIMKKLEKNVITALHEKNVEIIRAPFGWYKEFYIHCYGHPVSELSRRYGEPGKRNTVEKDCYSLKKTIESFKLKPVFRDVFIRWGYLDRSGVFTAQLNTLIARIQSIFNMSLRITATQLCRLNEIIRHEKIEPPALIVNTDGYHILALSENDLDKFFTKTFDEPYSKNNGKLYLKDEEIGICANSLCITYPLEIILAKRVYIAIKESESSNNPPTLECWLSPVNIYIATATGSLEEKNYAEKIVSISKDFDNLRVYIDNRKVRLGRKLRDAGQLWSNYTIIVGKNDIERKTLTIRDRREGIQFSVRIDDLETKLEDLMKNCKSGISFIRIITG
jgi:hypothetical protein